MKIEAVIFDLDGVIVSTDEYHYQAWKRLADEEGITFDRQINQRLRGVSRMESLEILIEQSPRAYTQEQKKQMAERKNNYYRELLQNLTADAILPGVMGILADLRQKGIKRAIGSSSKNCRTILERIGLVKHFNVIIDGNDISKSKPDPQVFLLAAERLGISPTHCLVVEDAESGVEAALAAGMPVLGLGYASKDQRATRTAADFSAIPLNEIFSI